MSTDPEASTFPIVGVGASAGGVEAFSELLRELPLDTGMGFVLVQHLDPTHPSLLSMALSRATRLPVQEIVDGMTVERNHVYVIPPGVDVGLYRDTLSVLPRAPDRHRRHQSINFFLGALAAGRGNQAIGVVLSGTGTDGSDGLRAIKAAGGITFAQTPASARFAGMPESAVNAGVVDLVLPLKSIAEELARLAKHPHTWPSQGEEPLTGVDDDPNLREVVRLLRVMIGADLSDYKVATVKRRLARRMALKHQAKLGDYVRLLSEDRSEAQALFEEILIHVSSFFRDGESFEKLASIAFPEILRSKPANESIRIWVAGCSNGEEAYSVAITLREVLDAQEVQPGVQIFGTDVSEQAVAKARIGWYPESAARSIGPERLARFFTQVDDGYRVNREIRELCAFSRHDLTRDPPFSKLDLVCCRNVLIYFNPTLQKRVLAMFHFGLKAPGFLLLGQAENPVESSLFAPSDGETKLFARTGGNQKPRIPPADASPARRASTDTPRRDEEPLDLPNRTEAILLDRYAPPGVEVNEWMDILHFRGRTGRYLEPAPGQPKYNLVGMAREGLLSEIRIGLAQAKKENGIVRRTAVAFQHEGAAQLCDIEVIPVGGPPEVEERIFAVLFEEARPALSAPGEASRLAQVEAQLTSTREALESFSEANQRIHDEAVTANEELVSSNEELQSLNEELETAKEELQSSNEELTTLNEELQTRNTELGLVNSDILNILGSVEVPIVIVDGDRRIRRFTPNARPILNLMPSDVGRPIDDIKANILVSDLDQQIAEVIETVSMKVSEIQDRNGRWHRLQIRPYLTADRRIDGAVISIIDIDVLKRALGTAEWGRDFAAATVEAVQTPLVVLDGKSTVISANRAFYESFSLQQADTEGRSLYELNGGAWELPELRAALSALLADSPEDTHFRNLQFNREIPKLGKRSLSISAQQVKWPTGVPMVLLTVEDVSQQRAADTERARLLGEAQVARAEAERANRSKDVFLATLSHELRTPLSSLLLQAQLLRKGEMDPQRLERASRAIERAAHAQAQLVDDLLDVSRIVAGKLKMELQTVNLALIVRTALDTVRPSLERKSLLLKVTLDDTIPAVSGDPIRLEQVVWNLLSNALKFTPKGGQVNVDLDAFEGQARIRVSDSGTGIEPSFVPHLFTRFSQEAEASTRTHGGLGLGLAIVKHLIAAHGGSISAESAGKGRGATFTVLIPLSKGRPTAPPLVEAAPEPELPLVEFDRARILLVEDDPGNRTALSEMLRIQGAEVCAAESAVEAMEHFEVFQPQLMICDIAMPDENGYSLIKRIRALGSERGGNVPALALTALASDEDRYRALAVGFQAHMAKPVDVDRLLATLRGLLEPAKSN